MNRPSAHQQPTLATHSASRCGFTILEMLMVVALVIVLSAVLLPTISLVRGLARTGVCAAHLRQLGMASLNYAQDWRGCLPAYSEPNGRLWYLQLDDYIDEAGSRHRLNKIDNVIGGCPLFRRNNPANPSLAWNTVSYGLNAFMEWPTAKTRSVFKPGDAFYGGGLHQKRFRLAGITEQSRRILIGDSNAPMLAIDHTHKGWEKHSGLADPDRHGGLIDYTTPFAKRRGQSGANYLMVDGRVLKIASRNKSERGVYDPAKATW